MRVGLALTRTHDPCPPQVWLPFASGCTDFIATQFPNLVAFGRRCAASAPVGPLLQLLDLGSGAAAFCSPAPLCPQFAAEDAASPGALVLSGCLSELLLRSLQRSIMLDELLVLVLDLAGLSSKSLLETEDVLFALIEFSNHSNNLSSGLAHIKTLDIGDAIVLHNSTGTLPRCIAHRWRWPSGTACRWQSRHQS